MHTKRTAAGEAIYSPGWKHGLPRQRPQPAAAAAAALVLQAAGQLTAGGGGGRADAVRAASGLGAG